ncbi:hypothetical protein OV208_14825 [Corallococcus sp. bb12-1]|uniref:hypothetical protein n=1 Tax=Corallococcus sp. bb12-1 TaxID=2996784 RepID=UPI00226F1530|nr:hypothetical protein [Corallococcus sp. bb12-1]MCY1042596.1 hypothetical protein [Corallococcus sp. bb12-1]
MSETQWFFPTTQGGEESGLNDPGIEFFRKSGSLARETIQNSGDARVEYGKPVTVTFELLQLPMTQVPEVDRLRAIIGECREYMLKPCKTERQKDENGRKWFEKALQLLSGSHLPVLRIRDENTTGLEGGELDEDKAWFRLIKKQGSASMHGVGGGTFGIGQRAPFAFSGLRTVFYSTQTRDGRHAFIGKTILSSFREKGQVHRPIGFWGEQSGGVPGVRAVRNANDIIEPFRRTSVGTDLYIMGFDPHGWKESIADSVVRNFFAAIQGGGLVVRLVADDGVQEFNAATLEQSVDVRYRQASKAATSKAAQKEVRDNLGVTRHYLKALSAPVRGKPSFLLQHADLGSVELYVTLDPDAPSRTVFMRKPRIRVYERTQNLLSGYAAVLLCEDAKGNDLLARMEDPSHSEWSKERLPGGEGLPPGDRLLTDIYAFVRESLKSLAQQDAAVPQDLPDLGRYLPEDDAIRPGVRQTGTRRRTQSVSDQESGRPQQAQGQKRAVPRPRPPLQPQVLLIPLEADEQEVNEALTADQGNGPTPGMRSGASLDESATAAASHEQEDGAGRGGVGRNGTEGIGPSVGPFAGPVGGTLPQGQGGTRAGPGPFGPEGPGAVEWQGLSTEEGLPVPQPAGGHPRQGGQQAAGGPGESPGGSGPGLRALSQTQVTMRAWFSAEEKSTHLLLRATRRGRATLRLTASGEDSDYELRVASAVDVRTGESFECVGDRILDVTFEARQGKELRLDLRPARRVAILVEVAHGA